MPEWEDRGRRNGIHEWRLPLEVRSGRRFVRVLSVDGQQVHAETITGYIRRFPEGAIADAKTYLEAQAAAHRASQLTAG